MFKQHLTLEIVMPVPELSPQQIITILTELGAKCLGCYAEFDPPKYGKGVKFMGSLIEIGSDKYTLIWKDEETKLKLYPVEWKDNYVMADQYVITVTGLSSKDTIKFKTEDDAKDWINTLSSIEQLKLNVATPTFNSPAVMFLAKNS